MSDLEKALHKLVQQERERLADHAKNGELNEYITDNAGDLDMLLTSLNHYFNQKAKEDQPNVAA